MGGCAAPGCSNCTEKGFKMYRFPRNPERRKIWVQNCGRTNWTPGSGAYLCEVHFDTNQFERLRQDNTKKLRQNSIPTIFSASSKTKRKLSKKKSKESKRRRVKRKRKDHFDEQQFEQHREDGWKKLKPNAIPTLFPETNDKTRVSKSFSVSKKRKAESEKTSSKAEKSSKKRKLKRKSGKAESFKKSLKSENNSRKVSGDSGKRKTLLVRISGGVVSGSSENSQKENVLPRLRKSPRPCKVTYAIDSDSSTSEEKDDDEDDYEIEEVVKEYKDTAAEQHVTKFKHEIESLKHEISEFEMHNKSMAHVIAELEKHNKLMSVKIIELEKENKVLTYKVGDLEKLNEDLKMKLNCSFTEEQLARMDKMRQLGTIERYIPALHQ